MSRTPVAPEPPRFLLVAPNWLGDVVMASPLLDILAAESAAERPRVTVAIRRAWAPLLANDPRVDRLLIYERRGRHRGVTGTLRLAADWRRESCAAVVLGPPSLRVAVAARLAGIERRIGYASDGRGWLLSDGLPVPSRGVWHHEEELAALGHEARRAVRLASAVLPATAEASRLRLPGLAAVTPAPVGSGPPCWLVGIGATYGEAKAWPVARVAELLRLAVGEGGVRAVLVGTADARTQAARLRQATRTLPWRDDLPGEAAVVDLTGRTDLLGLVALIRAAAGYVGNDSGPMHLAAALGVPTVGVFGSSSPGWTGPRGARAAVVVAEGFDCHPCFLKRCSREVFCLDTVAAEAVVERLLDLGAGVGDDRVEPPAPEGPPS